MREGGKEVREGGREGQGGREGGREGGEGGTGREGGRERERLSLPSPQTSNLPQEICLLCLTKATNPDVRQQLLLQNVLSVLYPLVPSHSGLSSSHTDEVQSHILLLDHKRLVQRGF